MMLIEKDYTQYHASNWNVFYKRKTLFNFQGWHRIDSNKSPEVDAPYLARRVAVKLNLAVALTEYSKSTLKRIHSVNDAPKPTYNIGEWVLTQNEKCHLHLREIIDWTQDEDRQSRFIYNLGHTEPYFADDSRIVACVVRITS